jgi:osmotically-inducible protein OsmY
VKAKIVAGRARNLFKINVDTENGVVRLKGTVPAEADKIEASAGDTPREPAAASPRTQ